MSYDIGLVDAASGEPCVLDAPHPLRGGTYAVGGTDEASLNVTYNYGKHFYRVLGERGIRAIYGMTGRDSLPVLDAAIAQLGTDESSDYWAPTEGNARLALMNLRLLGSMVPDGVWQGD